MAETRKDLYSLVRESLYGLRLDYSKKEYYAFIVEKASLLFKTFFRLIRRTNGPKPQNLFLTARELIQWEVFAIPESEPDRYASALDAYSRIEESAYSSIMGFLESKYFDLMAAEFPVHFDQFGAFLQFMDHSAQRSNKIGELIDQHNDHLYLVAFRLIQVACQRGIPLHLKTLLGEFFRAHRPSRKLVDLPFFYFDAEYTAGQVHKLQADFFHFQAMTSLFLDDWQPEELVPATNTISARISFCDRLLEQIKLVSLGQARAVTEMQLSEFELWKDKSIEAVERLRTQLQEREHERVRNAPISEERVEFLKTEVRRLLETWPVSSIDGEKEHSVLTVRCSINVSRELLLPVGSNTIDLAAPRLAFYASEFLFSSLLSQCRSSANYYASDLGRLDSPFLLFFIPWDSFQSYLNSFPNYPSFMKPVHKGFVASLDAPQQQFLFRSVSNLDVAKFWGGEQPSLPLAIDYSGFTQEYQARDGFVDLTYKLEVRIPHDFFFSNLIMSNARQS